MNWGIPKSKAGKMKKIFIIVTILVLFSVIPVSAKPQLARKAFLPNINTGIVTVVNLINKNVEDIITAGNHSLGVATKDKSGNVWVGDEINKKVIQINADTHEVETEYYLGYMPVGIAADMNRNRLYVTYNRIDNSSFAVFDIKTGKLIKRIDVGKYPFAVSVNPKSSHIYVVNRYYDDSNTFGTLEVIDGGKLKVTHEINIGFDPLGVAVNPSGDFVYTVGDAGVVYKIDTSNYSIADTVQVLIQPWGIVTNNKGDTLYVVNRRKDYQTNDGSISVIDLNSFEVIRNVDLGYNPVGVAVASDDSEVYVTQPGENNLLVIKTGDYSITHTIDVGDESYSMGDFLYEGR
jgi:DNA-binding beta-propeller fold protein YncE